MAILPFINTIAVGNSQRDRMLQAGYPAEKITVVPNFTDIGPMPKLISSADVPEFLYVGRIEKSKGIEWLLHAIRDVDSPILLNIAGEGSDVGACLALVELLGIAERVKFYGWIDRAQKIELFRRSRAVIVPSIWPEPFGIVAIEAGACSRPVIASNAGELPHIVRDGETGLIVPVSDIRAMSLAIEALAKNFHRSQEMGDDGFRRYSKYYTPAAHWKKLEEVYDRVRLQALKSEA